MFLKSIVFLLFVIMILATVESTVPVEETETCKAETSSRAGKGKLVVEHRNRQHPLVVRLSEKSTAMSAKFRSLSSRDLEVWYDDGAGGVEQAYLPPGKESTTNTYIGHSFFVTPAKNKKEVLYRFTISADKVLYAVEDPAFPGSAEVIDKHRKEEEYIESYLARSGRPWVHYFSSTGPRLPPTLYMWPADRQGDVHSVNSSQTHWTRCQEEETEAEGEREVVGGLCRVKNGVLPLSLEVVSLAPRALVIENFLSDAEVDELLHAVGSKMKVSSVGNEEGGGTRTSKTRTSTNSWVKRGHSIIVDSIYRRAGDLLQIDESLLRSDKNAEDLQLVHYENGQQYQAHHDWGVAGYPESRFLTLLMYLSDQASDRAGGETAFPKGGIKIRPKKGCAVLFYDLLEDGNGDDLSLHAALPVWEGEKWLANLWVWDPKRR